MNLPPNEERRVAFQDFYPEPYAQCYGCGRLNEKGLQVRSEWQGDVAICHFTPRPEHTAIPGYVYGGLLASIVDCHATGTAAAAGTQAAGKALSEDTMLRDVTASLQVDYRKPTPVGVELELRAKPVEVKGRKVVVDVELLADGVVTVTGHVICVQIPEHL